MLLGQQVNHLERSYEVIPRKKITPDGDHYVLVYREKKLTCSMLPVAPRMVELAQMMKDHVNIQSKLKESIST